MRFWISWEWIILNLAFQCVWSLERDRIRDVLYNVMWKNSPVCSGGGNERHIAGSRRNISATLLNVTCTDISAFWNSTTQHTKHTQTLIDPEHVTERRKNAKQSSSKQIWSWRDPAAQLFGHRLFVYNVHERSTTYVLGRLLIFIDNGQRSLPYTRTAIRDIHTCTYCTIVSWCYRLNCWPSRTWCPLHVYRSLPSTAAAISGPLIQTLVRLLRRNSFNWIARRTLMSEYTRSFIFFKCKRRWYARAYMRVSCNARPCWW